MTKPQVYELSQLVAPSSGAYILNPLTDPRWNDFVAQHPRASAFHQRGWLAALHRTYGYQPIVVTSAAPGEPLRNGIAFCYVSSWITGKRFVSLPFTDYCEPLLTDIAEFPTLIKGLKEAAKEKPYRYIELRPLFVALHCGLQTNDEYCFHDLDITPSEERLFRDLHKNSIQRKIRRAEKERLRYEVGCSQRLLDEFYTLLLLTRRRHQLPPQPRSWFSSIFESVGGNAQIRVVRKGDAPVAAIFTLRHQSLVIYKYGCSDEKFHGLGGMQLLFWRLIQESKAAGVEKVEFGRSELSNHGLLAFKEKFGAIRRPLKYYREGESSARRKPESGWSAQMIRRFVPLVPDSVLTAAGRMLYRHTG